MNDLQPIPAMIANNNRLKFASVTIPVLLLSAVMVSCSLFETRDPEEPGTTTVPVFITPERAQDVITNLQNAVKSLHEANYLRCLDEENFTYLPTSQAQSSNPDIWHGWSYIDEQTYFSQLRSEAEGLSGHDLQFRNEEFRPGETEAEYEADYVLTVRQNRSSDLEEVEGRLILNLVRHEESGDWVIRTWTDDGDGITWSDLRATFR